MEGLNNLENLAKDINKNKEQENILDLGNKNETIENYEYKDTFIDFINNLDSEKKERFLNILKNLPIEELESYLEDEFESDSEENGEYFLQSYEEEYYKTETQEEIDSINKDNNESKETIEKTESIRADIENLVIEISKLTKKEKTDKLIIDYYLGEINKFQNIDLNNSEKVILKEKYQFLKEAEIKEEKTEVKEEKTEVKEEKTKVKEEKTEVKKEKINKLDINELKRIEGLKYLNTKLDLLKSIDNDFYNKLEGIDLTDSNNAEEVSEKIVEYFSQEGKAKKFFNKLAQNSPEEYEKIYSALVNISPELQKVFDKNKILKTALIIAESDFISTNGTEKYEAYFLDSTDIKKQGNEIKSGDKIIDTSEIPPVAYITSENGLRIKSKNKIPGTLESKTKEKNKIKEVDSEIIPLKEKAENLKNEISELKENLTDYNSKLEQINNSELPEYEKEKYRKNIEEFINKTSSLIRTKELLYKEVTGEIQTLELKKKSIKENYEKEFYEKTLKYKDSIQESDEKARKAVQFLDSIGIDNSLLLPLESIIKIINRNSALRTKLGFNRKIDLSNNDLGISLDSSQDNGDNSIKEKQKFASIINILLTGENTRPIVTESMSTGTTFKGIDEKTNDKDRVIGDIKDKMGMNIYGNMFVNMMKYNPKNKKED